MSASLSAVRSALPGLHRAALKLLAMAVRVGGRTAVEHHGRVARLLSAQLQSLIAGDVAVDATVRTHHPFHTVSRLLSVSAHPHCMCQWGWHKFCLKRLMVSVDFVAQVRAALYEAAAEVLAVVGTAAVRIVAAAALQALKQELLVAPSAGGAARSLHQVGNLSLSLTRCRTALTFGVCEGVPRHTKQCNARRQCETRASPFFLLETTVIRCDGRVLMTQGPRFHADGSEGPSKRRRGHSKAPVVAAEPAPSGLDQKRSSDASASTAGGGLCRSLLTCLCVSCANTHM